MAANTAHKHDRGLLGIGAIFAGGGLYFALCGIGLVPLPGPVNGPPWLASAAGLAFFAAGVSVLIRGWLALPDTQPNLPPDTPAALVAIQWLSVLTIVAGLASVGTWIAFGAGERKFSMSLPFTGTTGEVIGRMVFGFGAIITWVMFAIVAYTAAGKIFRRTRP